MLDIEQLTRGHWLMALCCLLYLLWWLVFFWPQPDGRGVESGFLRVCGVVCILGAVVAGCGGVFMLVRGSAVEHPAVRPLIIGIIAVASYVVLLLVTFKAFDRQPTTELVLFVAWAAFEFSVLSALAGDAGSAAFTGGIAAYAVIIVVAFIVALVCYVLYYRLGPVPSFVDGIIPLAVIGVVEALLPLVTRLI